MQENKPCSLRQLSCIRWAVIIVTGEFNWDQTIKNIYCEMMFVIFFVCLKNNVPIFHSTWKTQVTLYIDRLTHCFQVQQTEWTHYGYKTCSLGVCSHSAVVICH